MAIRLQEPGIFTRTLDIIGEHNSGNEMVLRANKDTLLSRGTQEHIISMRETILENTTFGGYRIPEEWDQEWNFKLGPIWAPDSMSIATLGCWLKPEEFVRDSGDAAFTQATDSSSNSVDFDQSVEANMPDIGDKGLNNYRPLDYSAAGGDQNLFAITGDGNAIFNASASDEYFTAFVINTGTDTDTLSALLCHGNRSDNGQHLITLKWNGTNRHILYIQKNVTKGQWDNCITVGADHIITIGRVGGGLICRVDGTNITASTLAAPAANSSTDDTTLGMAYTGALGAANSKFDGKIYEMVHAKLSGGASSVLPDVKKIEGYLAHKFNLTASLPSDHDYKNNPPRASVTIS